MRIMPVSMYVGLNEDYWNKDYLDEAVYDIHGVSCLTHGHPRSQMGCMIYTSMCHELIYRKNRTVLETLQCAVDRTLEYYSKAWEEYSWFDGEFHREIKADSYKRLRDLMSFGNLPESEISSGGYVVHTLEAAIWCLLNSDSYANCVLKAVNLGDDTDTTGAVAGGLAGLCYGYDSIPKDWMGSVDSKEWVERMCEDLASVILERGENKE